MALSYYYDHQATIDAEIERQVKEVDVRAVQAASTHPSVNACGQWANYRECQALHGCARSTGNHCRTASASGGCSDCPGGWCTGFSDPDLLDRATALERILFTQDDDLLREAAERQQSRKVFAGVIYAHQERVSIGQCIKDLEFLAKAGELEDFANKVEYLPLK